MKNSILLRFARITIFSALYFSNLAAPTKSADKPKENRKIVGRTLAQWSADLDSQNEIVRLRAAKTLGLFGASAVPNLIDALNDSSAGVKYWAASELGDIGPSAKSALPQLKRLHKNEKFIGLRISTAYAICRLGQVDEGLPTLTLALKYQSRGVANSAADFLARIGPPAKNAIAALEEATKRKDYHIRGASLEALRRIRGSQASKQKRKQP